MIELTLLTLLNYVGDNFCEYRNVGHDNYKSLLLSYSDASNKFGPLEVKKIIEKSENFKVLSQIFKTIYSLAIIIIFCDVAFKLGIISRYYQIEHGCSLLNIEKSKSNFKKLSRLSKFKSKQRIWEFCREVIK